jgi:DNA transformation protein and related proteins
MASKQTTVDFLTDQLKEAGNIRSRKMFGEYAIYCDEKVVALVCDDQLFVKPTEVGRDFIQNPEEAPPYPGAKLYFRVSEEKWDDDEWLTKLVKMTAKQLPLPKKKKKL